MQHKDKNLDCNAPQIGEQLRDEGIAQVLENTPFRYRSAFREAALRIGLEGRTFTSEDITSVVGFPHAHPSAIGANVNALLTERLIVPTGRYTRARRKRSHAARLALYRLSIETIRRHSPKIERVAHV